MFVQLMAGAVASAATYHGRRKATKGAYDRAISNVSARAQGRKRDDGYRLWFCCYSQATEANILALFRKAVPGAKPAHHWWDCAAKGWCVGYYETREYIPSHHGKCINCGAPKRKQWCCYCGT